LTLRAAGGRKISPANLPFSKDNYEELSIFGFSGFCKFEAAFEEIPQVSYLRPRQPI
jgi:hypothetical protein